MVALVGGNYTEEVLLQKDIQPSGRDRQQAVPEPQQGTSREGGSDVATSSATREGKKQKLQDAPATFGGHTGHPGLHLTASQGGGGVFYKATYSKYHIEKVQLRYLWEHWCA